MIIFVYIYIIFENNIIQIYHNTYFIAICLSIFNIDTIINIYINKFFKSDILKLMNYNAAFYI